MPIAAHIAAAAGESLLLLVPGSPQIAKQAAEQAREAGLPQRRITARSIGGMMPEDVVQGLGAANERLVVLARGTCGKDDAAVSAHIAASRGVPVLVIEH